MNHICDRCVCCSTASFRIHCPKSRQALEAESGGLPVGTPVKAGMGAVAPAWSLSPAGTMAGSKDDFQSARVAGTNSRFPGDQRSQHVFLRSSRHV